MTAKIQLVMEAQQKGIPVICSMGAGNKLNPAEFQVADLFATSVCPLARVMRRELKKRGVQSLKVVYSKEEPIETGCRNIPGSAAFVPSVAGLIIASEVVKDLAGMHESI